MKNDKTPSFRVIRGGKIHDPETDLGHPVLTGEASPDTLDDAIPCEANDGNSDLTSEAFLHVGIERPLSIGLILDLYSKAQTVESAPSEVETVVPLVREQAPSTDDFFVEGEGSEVADIIIDFLSHDPAPERDVSPEQTIDYKPFFLGVATSLSILVLGIGFTYQVVQQSKSPVKANVPEVILVHGTMRVEPAHESRDGFSVIYDDNSFQETWDYESWMGDSSTNVYTPAVCTPTAEEIAAADAERAKARLFLERKEKLRAALLAWKAEKRQPK